MSYEKNKKFFQIYTLVILVLLIIRLSLGAKMNDLWQGITLFLIVLLSFLELVLMKILR